MFPLKLSIDARITLIVTDPDSVEALARLERKIDRIIHFTEDTLMSSQDQIREKLTNVETAVNSLVSSSEAQATSVAEIASDVEAMKAKLAEQDNLPADVVEQFDALAAKVTAFAEAEAAQSAKLAEIAASFTPGGGGPVDPPVDPELPTGGNSRRR